MIGRADIEGSKSNVAMNAWLPQASYPCGNFSDTSSFKFRRSKGSIGHAFTMCRPSQTPHLTMSSARIDPPKRVLGLKEGVVTPPPIHGSFHKVGLESSSTGSSFPADSAKSVPLAVVSLDSRQGHRIPLVRTSSELAVRRPGKAPKRAVPSPSPGRHEAVRSRHVSSSSSPPTVDGFGTGTPEPSPQSQSFSRSYGSILPTSLAYIVPSTRGCSPWRPDAVMSTAGVSGTLSSGFSRAAGNAPDTTRRAICTDGRSARARALGFAATAAPSYSSRPGSCPDGRYRCGPPPEFPLASPRSGIVHHLSGPDRHAHTRTLLRRSRSVGCAPVRDPANQLPCALWVYSPVDSHTCQTPWSVFQDGSNGEPTGRRPEHADAKARRSGHDGALTLSGAPFQGTWARSVAEDASLDYNSNAEDVRFSSWALPGRRALGQKAWGATCVQRLDGSQDSAIHTKYRILLRSSSMREPRYPLPRVVLDFTLQHCFRTNTVSGYAYDPTKTEVLAMDERITTESAGTVRNRPTESDVSSFSGHSVSRTANHPRRRDPNTSPDHSIGRSDGRGVLKATSADPWSASFMVETRTLFVFHKSKNFTSDYEIRMPPTACFEHSNFFKVTAPEARPGQLRPGAYHRQKRQADRTHRTSVCVRHHTQDVRQHTQDVCGCPCVSVCPSVHTGRPWPSVSTHMTSVSTRRTSVAVRACPCVRQYTQDVRQYTQDVRQHTKDVRGHPSVHTGCPWPSVSTHRTSVSTHRTSVAVRQHTQDVRQHTQDVRVCPCVRQYTQDVRQYTQDVRQHTKDVRGRPSVHTGRPWPSVAVRQYTQDVRQYTQDVRGRPSAHTGRPSAHAGRPWLSVCVRVSVSTHKTSVSTHRTSVSTHRTPVAVRQYTQDVRGRPSVHISACWPFLWTVRVILAHVGCLFSTHRTSASTRRTSVPVR
ncbi:hypothetical protein YC2023_071984 [Brassica napus]